ncbi:MAG: S-layer homology domain-containing protein [Propionibacteriaceae bacterium]|nr:S-layer homology domain-containing protein [Propionibacteriaceae bacterium]
MRRIMTRLTWLVLLVGMAFGGAFALPAQAATSFRDVPPGMQFRTEIHWLAEQKVTTGYPDGTYRPLAPVNRDAMAAFLYRLAGSPAYVAPSKSPFTDVIPSTQFYKEMAWLAATGISTGYPDGTYRPLEPVNRDAMAAFLHRFAGKPAFQPPAKSPFTDIQTSTQFYKEMAWLASTKVSTGYPDGTFKPLAPVRRDAMAAFMHRTFTRIGITNVPKVTQQKMITADQMLSAPVPSLCDNNPGRFVNGQLPERLATAPHAFAEIYGIDDPAHNWRTESFAAWMGTDNKAYAALVVACSQGGVGWPPEVVIYGAGPRVLGSMSVGELLDGRQHLVDLRLRDGGVDLDLANNYQDGEPGCCGTMDATVRFTWTGSTVHGDVLARYTERDTATKAMAAVNSGSRTERAKYFTPEGLGRIDTWGLRWDTTPLDCDTTYSFVDLIDPPDGTMRICSFTVSGEPRYIMGWMALTKTGFGQWKALQFDAITTD